MFLDNKINFYSKDIFLSNKNKEKLNLIILKTTIISKCKHIEIFFNSRKSRMDFLI